MLRPKVHPGVESEGGGAGGRGCFSSPGYESGHSPRAGSWHRGALAAMAILQDDARMQRALEPWKTCQSQQLE